jgi:hypothetical protein
LPGLPSISVLGRVSAAAKSRDINAIEEDVGRIGNEVIPLRRVTKLERADGTPIEPNDTHQDRAQDKSITRIQIIPDLPITIKGTVTVHVYVFTTELEERRGILVNLLEGVGLPIISVIAELDMALDFCWNMY